MYNAKHSGRRSSKGLCADLCPARLLCSKLGFRISTLKITISYHSLVVNKYHGSGNEASEVVICAISFDQLQPFVKL